MYHSPPWLGAHPQALKIILAYSPHPELLGLALTHKWITTDFTEALLEFIMPVDDDIDHISALLRNIHRYVVRHPWNEQLLWLIKHAMFY